ncbi:MAG: pseudouridine synthase [Chitinophagaceae bacterium]
MKHPKKGESYYEKTFGKTRPEAAPDRSEADKPGKKNWRNKTEFSEAPVRRGKNEVAAPKEMRGGTGRDRDDRKGGDFRKPQRPSGEFRDGASGYKKDKPAFRKDDRNEDRPSGEFRKERGGFKKEDGSFREGKPAFRRNDRDDNRPSGEFRKERGGFKKEEGGFREGKPAFRRNDRDDNRPSGEFRKERGSFKKEDGDFREGKPAFRKNDRDDNRPSGEFRKERDSFKKEDGGFREGKPAFRKDKPGSFDADKKKSSFPKEAPLSLQAENEVVHEKIGSGKGKSGPIAETPLTELMPLNKYIAHCGISSRRDAAELIRQGKVKINGELVTEPGHKVEDGDQITVSGRKVTPQKDLTYILLNKPKGFITTTEDERGRRTVMDLVSDSGALRLYPIGRLDRNTTGLILLTNDGELSQKLSHPKYNVKKIYHVTLDKAISSEDFEKILAGVELEDGVAPVDSLSMLEERNELGIEIHSGKNRIVRRIFEHLGYEVARLDRVMYAGLTKKNLPRGKWRKLTEREVIFLKHFKQ